MSVEPRKELFMSDCRGIKERLGRYFDAELTPSERRSVEDHLEQCSRCRAGLEEIREISGIFREGMDAPPAPLDLTRRIMGRAQAEIDGSLPGRSFLLFWRDWSLPMRFAALGVAAVACYIGMFISSSSLTSAQRPSDDMKWVDMSSREPIVSAYVGKTR
jgi:anti-sigma factor RsiW